jgi:UDP-glucose 4-epimerase
MKVFVCGGAGYIGAHLVREMKRAHWSPIVVDSLRATEGYRGHLDAMSVPVEVGDVRDSTFLDRVFAQHKPDAVVHMCASIVVPESVADPLSYYDNNVVGTLRILQAMTKHRTPYIILSSTAALFGTTDKALIEPGDTKQPESPYGRTKLMCEEMIADSCAAYGIKAVCLRYFNACGADRDGDIGETHKPETHLIPLVLQVPLGQRERITIFGSDYPTPDGTCVRDYVHVTDLSSAHIAALRYLSGGGASDQFNLGSGRGFSVQEVIEAARRVTGHPIPSVVAARRPGDPPSLVASSERAERVLEWRRQYATIDDIIASAWKFHQAHPNGYEPQAATASLPARTASA